MALNRRFPMEFGVAFPLGLFVISEVDAVLDFEKSTKDRKVQQFDQETGLPLWQVTCLDPDPEAKKSQKTVTVKIAAKHQPVPPENKDGSPFTPVEFDGLMALPWIEESGNFSKISWSFRAEEMRAPSAGAKKPPATGSAASGSSSGSSSAAA